MPERSETHKSSSKPDEPELLAVPLDVLLAPRLELEGGVPQIIAEAAEDMLMTKWAAHKL